MGFANQPPQINAIPKTQRRVFKTHAPHEFLMKWTNRQSKVVYLARNPKDVAVSLWHHSRSKATFG